MWESTAVEGSAGVIVVVLSSVDPNVLVLVMRSLSPLSFLCLSPRLQLFWINPVPLQTIPELLHFHVISRKTTQSSQGKAEPSEKGWKSPS